VVVFGGPEDEAVAAQAALSAAGIEAVSMADNSYLPGVFNLVTTVEVAVPRSQALEAAHVLRVPPAERAGRRPRHRGPVVMLVALIVLASLGFWMGTVILPRL
jgi:hypothetical protein